MGYLHIENLYRNNTIQLFRRCYAMEKIHGTSAHIRWEDGKVHYFSGGESHVNFVKLFNEQDLIEKFTTMGHPRVVVFGEAYGGKQQGMSGTYGKQLKFVAFDVVIDTWLNVPNAEDVVKRLGLEFVYYEEVDTDTASLDKMRLLPSQQAIRNGVGDGKLTEGVVLRPLFEFKDNRGDRVIVKYKNPEFSERASKKDTMAVSAEKLESSTKAEEIAFEWATPMRLEHVTTRLVGELGRDLKMEDMRKVIDAMIEDIKRESSGEVDFSEFAAKPTVKDLHKAIGTTTAKLFKKKVMSL